MREKKLGLFCCDQSLYLGVCYNGPLLVVYPDGIWYHHVDEALLERIIEEHLISGKPIEEYVFHRLGENPLLACDTPAGALDIQN